MNKFRFLFSQFLPVVIKLFVAKFYIILFKPKEYEDCWIVAERGKDARDNGYVFFKYLREKHPDKKCFYVISKDSADYLKVHTIGKTINYGSFAHYIAILKAKCLISSHIMGYTPNSEVFILLQKRNLFDFKAKKIFLQHGIIKDDIEGLKYPNVKVDMFVSGAYAEYTALCNTYRHPDGVVRLTGLARYDQLKAGKTKKQILIMPTWRKWLAHVNDEQFIASKYFEIYSEILQSKKVETWLVDNGYKILFYPHYEFQKYIHLFSKFESSNILVCSFDKYDVQELLKDCELLITDYSSVYFDVAYQHKPIIYLQFDSEAFFESHYQKGYFDESTFGYVVRSVDQMFDVLQSIYSAEGFKNNFLKQQMDFFKNDNGSCCENIYRGILEILNEQE